jgi:hypothetical protein
MAYTSDRSRQRIVAQFDSVRQVRRVVRQLLLGFVAVGVDGRQRDRANGDHLAIFRPDDGGVFRHVAGVGELHHELVLHRLRREAGLDLIDQEVRRLGLGFVVGEVVLSGGGEGFVAAGLLDAVLVHEREGIVAEERFGGEARGDDAAFLHELRRGRARHQELLDRPGVRLARVGGDGGLLEREEFFAITDDESVVRVGDDVGVAAAQGEADGHALRAGVGGVVGDHRIGVAVGESSGHGNGIALKVRRLGQRRRLAGGRERAVADDALGMDQASARVVPRQVDHRLEDLPSQVLVGWWGTGAAGCAKSDVGTMNATPASMAVNAFMPIPFCLKLRGRCVGRRPHARARQLALLKHLPLVGSALAVRFCGPVILR